MERSCKLLLTAVLLYILIHGISSFSSGVTDAGPRRLLCRYFRGMFHPLSSEFNQDSVSVDMYFTKLTMNKTFQDEPIAANCYESGEAYKLTITSSLLIQGLLLTAIKENGRLDYKPDTIGVFPVAGRWLNPNRLMKSVCANSVSHSAKINSHTVNIPWNASDSEDNAEFVFILVFSYTEYMNAPKHVIFPKCKKPDLASPVPNTMKPDSPSVNTTSIKPDSPSVNTTSIQPDSPSVNTTSIQPDSSSVNTTSLKPDSPSVNVTDIPSTKSD